MAVNSPTKAHVLFIARGASRLPAPGGRGGGRLHNAAAFLALGWERGLRSGIKNNPPSFWGHGGCHLYLHPQPRRAEPCRAVPCRAGRAASTAAAPGADRGQRRGVGAVLFAACSPPGSRLAFVLLGNLPVPSVALSRGRSGAETSGNPGLPLWLESRVSVVFSSANNSLILRVGGGGGELFIGLDGLSGLLQP